MPMATTKARQNRLARLYGKKGYRPQSQLKRPIGEVKLARGRQEAAGVIFNHFPQLGERLPHALGEIVVETTEEICRVADEKVPVGETHRLKDSQKVRYTHGRRTGAIVSSRIDYNPDDPTKSDPKHTYGFYVEVGTATTKAQPFLVPAVMAARGDFNAKCRNLESRL